MATINTRLILQSKNLFSNSLNQRVDKSFPITAEVLKRVKSITATSSGSATTLLTVSEYGADKDVFVFIRNRATAKAKHLYIIIGSQQIIKLAPGQYSILPWRTESGDDLKIYGDDSNGINVEYLVGTMT
tara:strand:- start:1474 stop:1863 length:390 start_codon:yes stop_codon:yes gene_type:complete